MSLKPYRIPLPAFNRRCKRVVRPRCAKCGDHLPFVRSLQGFTKCERHTILIPKKFGRGKNAYTKMVEVDA